MSGNEQKSLQAVQSGGIAGILVISNDRIRRVWKWNDGRIATVSIDDLLRGVSVQSDGAVPDVSIPGITDGPLVSASFSSTEHAATNLLPRHREAVVETVYEKGSLRQVFRLFENSPAIEMTLWMRSVSGLGSSDTACSSARGAVEDPTLLKSGAASVPMLDRLPLDGVHWTALSVEFHDATDHCNNLVEEHPVRLYRADTFLSGNLLFLAPLKTTSPNLFVVKESPGGAAQLDWCGHDFRVRIGAAEVHGCGFTDEEIDGWVRGYSCAVGVSGRSETERLVALRLYQKCLRKMDPVRDNMVMMNTWGDRARDGRLCESFALGEIAVARQLGITHFQLDDGWQKGLSHNSAFQGGSFPDLARMPDFWEPHPERFPNGLAPVVECGRQQGVTICLWFNPSSANDYAAWQQDADVMISLYRKFGLTVFKIDGVTVESKRGEIRLRKMFDAVVEASGGEVVFNLDVTAGRRFGFHYFGEYGNLFMENRYTDWGNWYPSWTFRNLWDLAKYVPPERIQAEFLNNARNGDKYADDDELAPKNVPFDTALAMTLAAQPLAWFEGTGLVRNAQFDTAKRVLEIYSGFSQAFHAGVVLPIGEEPGGRSVSGFQSLDDEGRGWIILVREATAEPEANVRVHASPGTTLTLVSLLDSSESIKRTVDRDGCLRLSLPGQWTYGIWRVER